MAINPNSVDLFSYFPGIEVTTKDIIEAELLIYQVLQSKYPELDLREGTGIRDLVIRPSSTLLAMLNKASLLFFQNNTLDGVTDSTPTTFVDSILSNWFITRKQGEKSIINARLYFAKSKNILVTTDTFFSNDGTQKYYPDVTYSLPASALTYDSGSNQYYVDVDMVAETEGTGYDITSGSLIYFSNFDPYFLHAEINYLKQAASNTETNSEFLSRAKSAISTRNLINTPSISSKLMEEFSIIDAIYSAGFGDPEMLRDYTTAIAPSTGNEYWFHRGGCVDIYCKVPLSSSILQFPTDASGKIYLTGPNYKVLRSLISGGTDPDTMDPEAPFTFYRQGNRSDAISTMTRSGATVTVTSPVNGISTGQRVLISGCTPSYYNGAFTVEATAVDTFTYKIPVSLSTVDPSVIGTVTIMDHTKDVGFSTRQEAVVDFGVTEGNKTVSLEVFYFQNLEGIQNYLEDKDNRVLCADLLARGFNISMLDIDIVSYDSVTPDALITSNTIKKYLAGLSSGQPFVMSDMLSELNAVGVKTLRTPVGVIYNKYWRDGLEVTTGVIEDYLDPQDSTNIFLLNTLTTSSVII